MPAELKLSPLRGGTYFFAGIGALQLRGGAVHSYKQRPLRRGHLLAGANVFDDGIMHLFLQVTTGFNCCNENKLLLLRCSIASDVPWNFKSKRSQ